MTPADWAQRWRDDYEELAGRLEYGGGITRAEAERVAWAWIQEQAKRQREGK